MNSSASSRFEAEVEPHHPARARRRPEDCSHVRLRGAGAGMATPRPGLKIQVASGRRHLRRGAAGGQQRQGSRWVGASTGPSATVTGTMQGGQRGGVSSADRRLRGTTERSASRRPRCRAAPRWAAGEQGAHRGRLRPARRGRLDDQLQRQRDQAGRSAPGRCAAMPLSWRVVNITTPAKIRSGEPGEVEEDPPPSSRCRRRRQHHRQRRAGRPGACRRSWRRSGGLGWPIAPGLVTPQWQPVRRRLLKLLPRILRRFRRPRATCRIAREVGAPPAGRWRRSWLSRWITSSRLKTPGPGLQHLRDLRAAACSRGRKLRDHRRGRRAAAA